MNLTPEQYLKWQMIVEGIERGYDRCAEVEIDPENIDELWEDLCDELQDVKYEFREGEVETDLPCESSRHYESYSVAAKVPTGKWIGWTYWYGGGKHGCPEEIDWMEVAYFLDCQEEEKLVVVRTFSKEK